MSRNAYTRMGARGKREYARDLLREPPVTCPDCEVQTTPIDLPAHRAKRCPGRRDPPPGARWIPWRETRWVGVPERTLRRRIQRGQVRYREKSDGTREYLLRDLVRVDCQKGNRQPNGLTNERQNDPRWGMKLDSETIHKLRAMATEAGGVEPLSRRLNVPTVTLKRAIAGAMVRRGTVALIEDGLRKGGDR
jgi:hypothetical protein